MKKLKFSGKLSLNKQTVAKLTEDQMRKVTGGYPALGIPANLPHNGSSMAWEVGTSGRNTCNCEGVECGPTMGGVNQGGNGATAADAHADVRG